MWSLAPVLNFALMKCGAAEAGREAKMFCVAAAGESKLTEKHVKSDLCQLASAWSHWRLTVEWNSSESVLTFHTVCLNVRLTPGLNMSGPVEEEDRAEPHRSSRESLNSIWSIEHPENFSHEADSSGRQ